VVSGVLKLAVGMQVAQAPCDVTSCSLRELPSRRSGCCKLSTPSKGDVQAKPMAQVVLLTCCTLRPMSMGALSYGT
jgi:hypothetical protein